MMIRKAAENDLQQIEEIYSDIHTEEEQGRVTIGWDRNVYPIRETAQAALQRGDLFAAEDDGRLVGTAIINRQQVDVYKEGKWQYPASDDEVMVLHTLVISPKVSGKGYGKKFVRFYEQYALKNGCSCLRMDTNERNLRARAMYRKLGYNEIGTVPCVFNGIEGVGLVLLEKKICGEFSK
ncbi:MAG: GNAT family N-acetyltransferase [Eubacteriales bacterium]|nr:GNAT family N-acetyltransferase [Eubacteriales bacterium]